MLTLLLACTAPAPDATLPESEPLATEPLATAPRKDATPYWVPRTDEALALELEQRCAQADAADKPILLAFSAPWCGDCKAVRALETRAPLNAELARWEKVVIDVGRFDRHLPLLKHFGVGRIAHWVAVGPDCREPVTEWKVLASDTLEPASGTPRTPDELAAWLAAARR